MSQYTPTTGTITEVNWLDTDRNRTGCGLIFTVQSMDQGMIQMVVNGSTYVLDGRPLNVGDRVTFFYPAGGAVPLIYPPRYQASVAVHTPCGSYAALDVFTQTALNGQLTNEDDTLRLNLSGSTWQSLPNGQPFGGSLSGKLLLVLYGATTRSVPAQTTPERIVVFC